MQDSYSVTQDLSYFDYVESVLYLLPRQRLIKRLIIFIFIVGVMDSVLTYLVPGKRAATTSELIFPLFAPVLIISLFFIVCTLLIALFVVKFKPEAIKGQTYKFTHWGMERVSAKSESTIPWRDVKDVKETKRFIFLFVKEKNADNVYGIKKENCKDSSYEDELKKFIDANRPL